MFQDIEKFSLPKIEKKVLDFWKANNTLEKAENKNKGKRKFVFYEGPPTANGKPGIHHVLSRSFKDIILRYKTMRGFQVLRRGGWDTHGLPVEIEVERELGLKSKKDIEKYGIAEFNKKCKESVWKYKDEWEKFTRRIGFWLEMDNPYITYENSYIETLWWIMSEIAKKKLLYKAHKVVPWCPRCGTVVSSHELALGYRQVKEPSVYVKFKLKPRQKVDNRISDNKTFILSWTTTQWTLPGNVALAVGKNIGYVETEVNGERLIYAKDSPFAKELGITEHVTSPTFVIMKKYEVKHSYFNNFNTLVHIDAYRLESGAELAALAFSGIVGNPKNIIFIEWPERVKEVLPKSIVIIEFAFVDETTRDITYK